MSKLICQIYDDKHTIVNFPIIVDLLNVNLLNVKLFKCQVYNVELSNVELLNVDLLDVAWKAGAS